MRLTVPRSMRGERVDRAVATLTGLPRTRVESLIGDASLRLDGRVPAKSARVSGGEVVEVEDAGLGGSPASASVLDQPPTRPGILFADRDVVVVDKPPGLVVHPGAGNPSGTLVQWLEATYPELAGVGEPGRPGIVHRLDKGTSGLMVVALSEQAHRSLSAQIRARCVRRRYLALAVGSVQANRGVIDAPVGRSERDRTTMTVSRSGRTATTRFRVLGRYSHPRVATLLECELETGRTHQVRVHLSAIGHPVAGDMRYGDEGFGTLTRPFLHASYISFEHPVTRQAVELASDLPSDLESVLLELF